MTRYAKILVTVLLITGAAALGYAEPISQWVSLETENKRTVKGTIMTEVDKREGYSTLQEEAATLRVVNDEKAKEDSAYKNSVAAAKAEFIKTKNKRDNLTTQLQATSSEIEELRKEIGNIKAGMENCDSQTARFEEDIKIQQDSLKKWLKTEKQGEALVAALYTRGFKDKKHELDSLADKLSAPVMAADMGVYIQSYTKLVNNILAEDFIRAVSEGTAKWNGEEPVLIELRKGSKGTDYLRIKRYELYPFQEPAHGNLKSKAGVGNSRVKVALIGSMYNLGTFLAQNGMYNLETFLAENGHKTTSLDLSRVEILLAEIAQTNKLAAEGLTEQVNSIEERIAALTSKIANARSDKEALATNLARKEIQLEKEEMVRFASLSASRKEAERSFHAAQYELQAKNSVRETIIVKTVLTTPKGSQSPAEAASESIIDKLEEVRNEARSQHSSTTTIVSNGQLVDESTAQAVTQAKIVGVKLVSFINEGDSVKVKIAFKVRMALENQLDDAQEPVSETPEEPPVMAQATAKGAKSKTKVNAAKKEDTRKEAKAPAVDKTASKGLVAAEKLRAEKEDEQKDIALPEPSKIVPLPDGDSSVVDSAETDDFRFKLKSVKMSLGVMTVLIDAENKTESTRYLAMYDQSSRYTKSTLVDRQGKSYEVQEVFLGEGDNKTNSSDAGRGVQVDGRRAVAIEMIFKEVPSGNGMVKLLNLHPYSAARFIIYKWNDTELQFKNIRY